MKNLTKYIIKAYIKERKPMQQIAKELNSTLGKVAYTLSKNKIKSRSFSNSHIIHNFDRNFFKKIDTEEKAYFLGYFYADGNVHKNTVQICLHSRDEEFLIKFKRALKSDRKIVDDRGFKRFSINSEDFANDFRKLGCMERKTFLLKFPTKNQVPSNLIRHFMRGYFDGDGCITYSQNKKYGHFHWKFEIISTYSFCKEFQRILFKKCKFPLNPLIRESRVKKPIYYMGTGSTTNQRLLKIFDFLYKDSTIHLSRKYNKFLEINKKIMDRVEFRQLEYDKKNKYLIKVLEDNKDKPLWYLCKLLKRKDAGTLSNIYKRLNVKRKNAIPKKRNDPIYSKFPKI